MQPIHPFHFLAYAVLPDHFHCLLQIPEENPNFSVVVHSIKRNLTDNYKQKIQVSGKFTLWQKRFWDHVIRDETDLQNHFDYIHWNPVKHGYVTRPEEWEQSSFRHWLDKGYYSPSWSVESVSGIMAIDGE